MVEHGCVGPAPGLHNHSDQEYFQMKSRWLSMVVLVQLLVSMTTQTKDWREKDILEYTDKDFDKLGDR